MIGLCWIRPSRGVGRAELLGVGVGVGWGGGGPSSLKFLQGVGLGRGVKFIIGLYFLGGGGGVRATWKPLWLHLCPGHSGPSHRPTAPMG